MTIAEVEAMDREMLTPAIVAAVLGCDQQQLRMQARERPDLLGFPAICVGNRVKFPRAAFVAHCKGVGFSR